MEVAGKEFFPTHFQVKFAVWKKCFGPGSENKNIWGLICVMPTWFCVHDFTQNDLCAVGERKMYAQILLSWILP